MYTGGGGISIHLHIFAKLLFLLYFNSKKIKFVAFVRKK